jgi:ribonuclease Z
MAENVREPVTGEMRVTLLGTGGPTPVMERFGPATLVQAGGQSLLFDVGRGALQRLFSLRHPLKQVRNIFLTHLHSDHLVGLPDLWLTGWLQGRPEEPLRVWGPRGTRDLMTHLDQAFQFDIRIRLFDDRPPPEGIVVLAQEVSEGTVYEHEGVKVTAFEVDHSPIRPAFGYRIDYQGRAVAISGDTRFSQNVILNSRGVDVIVHEVIAVDLMRMRPSSNPELLERVIGHHTPPEQAGELFTAIQPRLAVYSHVLPVTANARDLIPATRRTYGGRLEVGEDLMVIDVGDEVTVHKTDDGLNPTGS